MRPIDKEKECRDLPIVAGVSAGACQQPVIEGASSAAVSGLAPGFDVASFIHEYYEAWGGPDLDRIMSYYADNVVLQIPRMRMEGKDAVRDQFVVPVTTAFPGNRHIVKKMAFGPGVVVVEFSFEAEHNGAFAGQAATGARVKLPGCGVYEYDSAKRQITAGRIYFEAGGLLQTVATLPAIDTQKAAEALPLNERNLSTIINTIPTTAWTTGPDGYCDFLNQRWLNYAGMTAEQAKGWGWAEAIHPDDRPGLVEYWQSCLASGVPAEAEGRMRRFDGSYRWFLFRANPGRDESGNIVKWYGTNIDIDDRKKAEEALQASERNLSLTINTIPTFIAVTRPDGFILSVNQAALNYHGITLHDTQQDDFRTRFYHPDDWPRLGEQLKDALQRGQAFEYEVRALSKEGEYRWFLVRCNPLLDEQGRIERWYVTAFDIQDRKHTEEALRKSGRQFRLLVETIPALVWRSTPKGDLDYLNHRAVEYLGHTAESLAGGRWLELVHPDHREATLQRWLQSATTGTAYEDEYQLRRADGQYRWVQSVGEPFLDTEGQIANWYGLVIDIEDRKRAEEALARQAAVRSEISAAFSKPTHLREILSGCTEAIVRYLDAAFARIWILSTDESVLELQASAGMYTRLDGSYRRIHIGDLKVGLIARAKKAHFTNDILHDPRVKDKAWAQDNGMVAFAGYPLVVEDRLIGVVALFARRPLPESILDTLASVADTIAQGIERKRAEEAVCRSEAFLAEGQRLSHLGSWGWNSSTGKLTWSQEHFRILGLDPQLTNSSLEVFWERVHPDDRVTLRRAFECAIRDKRDFEQEFRVVTPDWSIRHLHGVGHAVMNQAHELVEFIGSTMDITERKRAEERAQSQREAIRLALNAFIEELDVNRFLGDVVVELNKQFHATSWELWLFDEAAGAFLMHSSSHQGQSFHPGTGSKTARRLDELRGICQIQDTARVPRIMRLPAQESLLSSSHAGSLKALAIKTLIVVPLVLGEQNLGFLELHFQEPAQFTSDDLELAQALVNHATLALQLNRLTRRAEQLAVTEERNRLARDIHDTLAQAFAGIVLHSEALATSLADRNQGSLNSLSQIQKLARSGLDEARRSVQALRPRALEGSTLSEALKQAAKRLTEPGKLSCHFRQQGETQLLSPEAQNELFRIAQEALTNISKHAQAKSVWINLTFTIREVALTIRDNGVGLAATTTTERKGGYGLGTMRERAQRIGGQLELESPKSGGTSIRVRVPLSKSDNSITANVHQ